MKRLLFSICCLLFAVSPAFGVGTFAYTVATNKIVVTDGTSGAPATFNDMYTADQAGTGTVLNVAENGAANVTLDYQIRPTHSKALIIKCIVAAKTAEADFIFITGTDAWDTAQTESLDVTAGNGTYTTTKRFKTITNLDCSDNAAGGGTVWADGTIAVTQDIWGVVWEIVADGSYLIDCDVEFGDGSTATYFRSAHEFVYWENYSHFSIKANATLDLGESSGDWSKTGSAWSFDLDENFAFLASATAEFGIYGSMIIRRDVIGAWFQQTNGTWIARNSIFSGISGFPGAVVVIGGGTTTWTDVKSMGLQSITAYVTPTFSNIHLHDVFYGLSSYGSATPSISNLKITDSGYVEVYVTEVDTSLNLIDPDFTISSIIINNATASCTRKQTCNIHVADEDGADLETVTVQCQTFGNVVSTDAGSTFYKCILDHTSGVFATDLTANKWVLTTAAYAAKAGCVGGAGTGAWVTGIAYVAAASEFSVATDSGGDIAEQTIDYKKWIGTSEALLTYSPHTFTLTYGGDTHVVDDFTVSAPVVWNLEFPPQATLLSAIYAATITNATGTDIAADIIALKAETVSILEDTAAIQGKLPTNKIMGSSDVDNHDTDIDSILTDTTAYDTDAEYATAIWGALVASYTGETTFGGEMGGLDPNITLILADTSAFDTAAEYAAAIWNAATGSYGGAGTYGQAAEDVLADTAAYDTDAEHAAAIWNALMATYTTEASFGGEVQQLDPNITLIKAVTDVMRALTTTVADDNDANSFTLTAGAAAADAYRGATIYVRDATDAHWESRTVYEWTAGRIVEVDLPFSFTPAVDDVVILWGMGYFPMDVYDNQPVTPPPGVITIDRTAASGGGGTATLNAEGDDP